MISVDIGGFRFQLRAAAVVVHDRFVLLHRLEGDEFWALPGGRVEPGEDARSTLIREMNEELAEPVECGELVYVVENFFTHAGRPNHEVGLYFATRLKPGSVLLDRSRSHWGVEGVDRLEFRWFSVEQLTGVDLRPSFLLQSLSQPALQFQHFVQRG
jgi:ADP-ribose pyrophosphatase YjhB (NUDIX family)